MLTSQRSADCASDLEALSAPDETRAGEAFERLLTPLKRSLLRRFRQWGFDDMDSEDLMQNVALRVWSARRGFKIGSPGAWWGFLLKTARNCAIDEIRKRKNLDIDIEDVGEIPAQDMPYLDVLVLAAEDRAKLYTYADRLWLGKAADPALADRQLLAAQLFYLHGLNWQAISTYTRASQDQIDAWLADPAVHRQLAYQQLYWSNDRLAGYLARPSDPCSPRELDSLTKTADSHFLLLMWRVRNGLTTDQILRFAKCDRNRAELEELFAGFCGSYPFVAIATKLRHAINQVSSLANTGLWRRLVFGYHSADELPHKQILERAAPAAALFGTQLTEATLNGWLGMGRLWVQLAAFIEREAQDAIG